MLARTPAATIKRRYRQRLRAGIRVLRIPVHETRLIEALLRSRRLNESEALDPARVQHEVELILADWVQRWC
jgi:hypothetical protein